MRPPGPDDRETLRVQVGEALRRGGIVVAMSGGVDSSVCAALAVEAVGPPARLGLGLPERRVGPTESRARQGLGRSASGIEFLTEDITTILAACGCYERRDAARFAARPEYRPGLALQVGA